MKQLDKDMQDKELLTLISRAQEGDIEAANAVVYAYRNLAKSIARSYFLVGAESDDIMQIGMLGLFKAVQTFKIDGGATFKTYASNCIRNIILDEIRKSQHNTLQTVPIDEALNVRQTNDNLEESFIQQESIDLLYKTIDSLLTPLEKDVLTLHLESLSYKEIASELQIEKKKVDNTIYSIRKKLKKIAKN